MIVTDKQIEFGFWVLDKANDFPPASITYPKEYTGQSKVNIACTQLLNLSSNEQKKLIKEWVDFLPTCKDIEMLWFTTKLTKELFNSVCELKDLVGLYIKHSNIKALDNIASLPKLRYLNIGSSAQIESIAPLSGLKQLEVLRIENTKKISDFSLLSNLSNLQFISIEGSMYSKLNVESFEPFSHLTNLVYFSAVMINCDDKQIDPILKLKKLKTLNWPFGLTSEDMDKLKQELPNLKYSPNRYFQKNMNKLKSNF